MSFKGQELSDQFWMKSLDALQIVSVALEKKVSAPDPQKHVGVQSCVLNRI